MVLKVEQRSEAVGPIGVVSQIGVRRAGALVAENTTGLITAARTVGAEAFRQGTEEAEVQAASDVRSYQLRNESGALVELPKTHQPFSVYGSRYQKAMQARYTSELEVDIQGGLGKIATENRMDPDAFLAKANAYLGETAKRVDPTMAGTVSAMGRTVSNQYHRQIDERRADTDFKAAGAAQDVAVDQLSRDAVAFRLSGQQASPAAMETQQRLMFKLQEAVTAGFYDPAKYDAKLRALNQDLASAGVIGLLEGNDSVQAERNVDVIRTGPAHKDWAEAVKTVPELAGLDEGERARVAARVDLIVNGRRVVEQMETSRTDASTALLLSTMQASMLQDVGNGVMPTPAAMKAMEALGSKDPAATQRFLANLRAIRDAGVARDEARVAKTELAASRENAATVNRYQNAGLIRMLTGEAPPGVAEMLEITRPMPVAVAEQVHRSLLIEREAYARSFDKPTKAMQELSAAMNATGNGNPVVIANSSALSEVAQSVMEANLALVGKSSFSLLSLPEKAQAMANFLQVGVIPEGATNFMRGALVNTEADPARLSEAVKLYGAIRESNAQLGLGGALGDTARDAYENMWASVKRGGDSTIAFAAARASMVEGVNPRANNRLLLGATHNEQVEKLADLREKATASMRGATGFFGNIFEPMRAPMPPAMASRLDELILAKLPRYSRDNYEAAAEASMRDLVVTEGWGISRFSTSQYGRGNPGELNWARYSPETSFPSNNHDWVEKEMKRVAEAATGKPFDSELYELIHVRMTQAGTPIYQLHQKSGGVWNPMFDGNTNKPVEIDLAPVYKKRKEDIAAGAKADRAFVIKNGSPRTVRDLPDAQ